MRKKTFILFGLCFMAVAGRTAEVGWVEKATGSTNNLFSVYFCNANLGWAVGTEATILRTTDGGETWTSQANPQSGTRLKLRSVAFINGTTGMAVGHDRVILKTTNAGNTWIQKFAIDPNRDLRHVTYVNDTLVFVFGELGVVYRSTNGGENWTLRTTVDYFDNLWGGDFADASTGWGVGDGGEIIKTTDGGNTWFAQSSGITDSLKSVCFVNTGTGWAVGNNGVIIKTENGGETWFAQNSGNTDYLKSVHFINPDTGWVAGGFWQTAQTTFLLKTTDGGDNWFRQTVWGGDYYLNDLHFIDDTTGFASGLGGVVLKTTTAGETPLLNVDAFLEGACDSTEGGMTAFLNELNCLPLQSPYTEDRVTLESMPAGVTDWVLIELRKLPNGITWESRSMLLCQNGTVMNMEDGLLTPGIPVQVERGYYFIVVKHRNHLAVMSRDSLYLDYNLVTAHDFTDSADKYYGTGGAKPISGRWVLYAGDGNQSGIVTQKNGNEALEARDFVGYHPCDYNLSGIVTIADVNIAFFNRDRGTTVPGY